MGEPITDAGIPSFVTVQPRQTADRVDHRWLRAAVSGPVLRAAGLGAQDADARPFAPVGGRVTDRCDVHCPDLPGLVSVLHLE